MVGVRQIGADDWRVFKALRLAALAEAPVAFGSRLAEWEHAEEARWRGRLESVALNLVASLDGLEVGLASGSSLNDDTIELISMWVRPVARGRGVGEALVTEVRSWARARGVGRLTLDVVADNGPARALYRRMGFVDVGAPRPRDGDLVLEQAMALAW